MHGEVDIVDFQSMPDGDFKFLLNYIDNCVKKLTCIPLVSKWALNVVLALLQIFTVQDPLANSRLTMAMSSLEVEWTPPI